MPPVPVILVGEEYWRGVFNVDFLVDEGTIAPEDRDLFWYAETAEQIWRDILTWYEMKGEPCCRPAPRRFACRVDFVLGKFLTCGHASKAKQSRSRARLLRGSALQ